MKAILIKRDRDWSWSLVQYCPDWFAWFWKLWYKLRLYTVEIREVSDD